MGLRFTLLRPVFWLACVLVLGVARDARALTEFVLVMAQPPYSRQDGCLLCHVDNTGGSGTAVRPFALTLQEYGVGTSSDSAELRQVLEQLGDEDSDDDDASDLEELLAGADPNTPGGGEPTEILVYEYGCASALLPGSTPHCCWSLLLLLLGCVWVRRGRRSRRAG